MEVGFLVEFLGLDWPSSGNFSVDALVQLQYFARVSAFYHTGLDRTLHIMLLINLELTFPQSTF